jgi:hypothetical protein
MGHERIFKAHALWTLSGESTYDAINYLFSVPAIERAQGAVGRASLLRLFMMLLAVREHFACRQGPQLGQVGVVSSGRATAES